MMNRCNQTEGLSSLNLALLNLMQPIAFMISFKFIKAGFIFFT
jgi:hypothetical protein